jgi:eukaryotic-like serine/threonine-protein kinase
MVSTQYANGLLTNLVCIRWSLCRSFVARGTDSDVRVRAQPLACGLFWCDPRAIRMTEQAIQIGSVLQQRYRLIRTVGTGGMGVVYEAEDLHLQRSVAVKVLRDISGGPQETGSANMVIERFRQEAHMTAQLGHPHIVPILDFVASPVPFIVMELLRGESLAERLARDGAIPPAAACFMAVQMLSALSAAHVHGVVHRDIKPRNIFLVASPASTSFVKVLDFGIAKLLDRQGAPLTLAGQLLGTTAYMAPEQIRGAQVGPATDVYAVGCVMYEMLSGRPLYVAEGQPQMIAKVLQNAAIPPIQGVPPALMDALNRALAHEVSHRFATAADMQMAISAFAPRVTNVASASLPPESFRAASVPNTPAPVQSAQTGPLAPAPYVPHTAAAPAPVVPSGRSPWVVPLLALLLVATSVGATVGVLAFVNRGKEATKTVTAPMGSVPSFQSLASATSLPSASITAVPTKTGIVPANASRTIARPDAGSSSLQQTKGTCLCLPFPGQPGISEGPSNALVPVFTTRSCKCSSSGMWLCATKLPCTRASDPLCSTSTHCPGGVYTATGTSEAKCSGWNELGESHDGIFECTATGGRRIYPGPDGTACEGFQSAGVRLKGKTICN